MRSSSFLLRLLPFALIFGLAGCTTEITYNAKTADGQKVAFTMIDGFTKNAKAEGIETFAPRLEPDPKQKKIRYNARLVDTSGLGIRSIKLEDVSDEKVLVLIEENDPKLKDQVWLGSSAYYGIEDEQLHWLTYIDQSFKVYRYTVTRPDGHTVVLYEGSMIPGYGKAILRGILGEKY